MCGGRRVCGSVGVERRVWTVWGAGGCVEGVEGVGVWVWTVWGAGGCVEGVEGVGAWVWRGKYGHPQPAVN